jgi:hypothetical protein
MKYSRWIVVSLGLLLLLTGCVKARLGVDVSVTGASTVAVAMGLSQEAVALGGEQAQEFLGQAEKSLPGLNIIPEVRRFSEGGYEWVEASFLVPTLEQLNQGMNANAPLVEEFYLVRMPGFLKDSYLLDATFKPVLAAAGALADTPLDPQQLAEFQFQLRLPGELQESNGVVDAESNTSTWTLSLDQPTTVHAASESWNILNLFLLAAGGVLLVFVLFAVIAYLALWKPGEKRKPAPSAPAASAYPASPQPGAQGVAPAAEMVAAQVVVASSAGEAEAGAADAAAAGAAVAQPVVADEAPPEAPPAVIYLPAGAESTKEDDQGDTAPVRVAGAAAALEASQTPDSAAAAGQPAGSPGVAPFVGAPFVGAPFVGAPFVGGDTLVLKEGDTAPVRVRPAVAAASAAAAATFEAPGTPEAAAPGVAAASVAPFIEPGTGQVEPPGSPAAGEIPDWLLAEGMQPEVSAAPGAQPATPALDGSVAVALPENALPLPPDEALAGLGMLAGAAVLTSAPSEAPPFEPSQPQSAGLRLARQLLEQANQDLLGGEATLFDYPDELRLVWLDPALPVGMGELCLEVDEAGAIRLNGAALQAEEQSLRQAISAALNSM